VVSGTEQPLRTVGPLPTVDYGNYHVVSQLAPEDALHNPTRYLLPWLQATSSVTEGAILAQLYTANNGVPDCGEDGYAYSL